ncbi:Long-chain base-1-phosphate phosphatase [Coemansia sp. Benny D115]|nr:Long-chain base-1-phosphate phosphatase [Coemansia sp. Benny D115]
MPPRFQLDEDDDVSHEAAAFIKAPEHVYQIVYSPLRQKLRQWVVQEVEREMPALVAIQQKYRTPLLDTLFVLTGMLGNHAFFMLALPFIHVFGGGQFARGLTFVVLWSIYFSGWIKDYISAPRPSSPPIVQITRSPAHTFEYGFPSSHTTYVVATILYISYFMLNEWGMPLPYVVFIWVSGILIVVGRVYCGLHSFIDVIGGTVVGAVEAMAFVAFYPRLDTLLLSTPGPLYLAAALYVALKNIPRSLDLCPCCIDSFCATSVTLGLIAGTWIHARLPFLWHNGMPDRIAWSSSLSLVQNFMRCAITVVLVVAWKIASKAPLAALVQRVLLSSESCCDDHSNISDTGKHKCRRTSLYNAAVHSNSSDDTDVATSDKHSEEKPYSIPSSICIAEGRFGTYELMFTPENFARVPIYAGIGVVVYVGAPLIFYFTGLLPV